VKSKPADTFRTITPGLVEVTSGTSGTRYAVRPVERLCQCDGFKFRKACRHIDGAAAFLASRAKTAELTARGGQCAAAGLVSKRPAAAHLELIW
jgi:hypothetical protein